MITRAKISAVRANSFDVLEQFTTFSQFRCRCLLLYQNLRASAWEVSLFHICARERICIWFPQDIQLRLKHSSPRAAWLSFFETMVSSFEPSTGRFKAQLVKERLITSVGSSAQASQMHCNITRHGRALRFPAPVSSLIPTVPSHSSYFSVHEDLKGLFQLTSGA